MAVPPDFLPSLADRVYEAFRLWHKGDTAGSPLQILQLYQQRLDNGASGTRQATNQLLYQALETLTGSRAEHAEILRLRFVEERTTSQVANRFNIVEGNVWKKQREGIDWLAEWLREQEWQLREGRQAQLLSRLEKPTYTQLFGIDEQLANLTARITPPGPPWLLALEGIGGIGKTTMADAFARQLLVAGEWNDFAWVTARQRVLNLGGGLKQVNQPALTVEMLVDALLVQLLPQGQHLTLSVEQRLTLLRQRLQRTPHLIVLDNLETQVDVTALLETLRTLVNPTKFLLTSRHRLLGEPDIFHFVVPELSESAALALVRQEAEMRNLPDLVAAADADLHPIFQAVGGNPLALRLVVGQLHTYPLDQILADLREARGQPIANLYDYIYRQAWEQLAEVERRTLLLLPLVPEQGANFTRLASLAKAHLSEADLRQGLNTLVQLSLVDARGTSFDRRYTIHSLTRTFLHEQILRWGQ